MEKAGMQTFTAEPINDETYLQAGHQPLVSYEELSHTLVLDDVELRLDFQLGDDDLEVSLLVESLEEQYRDMLAQSAQDSDTFLSLQSAKEWVSSNRSRMAGLFRYLKSLSDEQL